MKPYVVLIPESIDIDRLVKIEEGLNPDIFKYLIHEVLTKESFKFKRGKAIRKKQKKGYVRMNAENSILHNSDFSKYMKILTSTNYPILYRASRTRYTQMLVNVFDNINYEVGKHSRGYKINRHLRKGKLKLELIEDSKLVNKIKKKHIKIPSSVSSRSGKFNFQTKYFNPLQPVLKIDLHKAANLAFQRYQQSVISYSDYVSEMVKIVDFYNGLYKLYHSPNTDDRLHTNLTMLPKVYRKYVTYNNKPLIEIDISNSIIYFFSILLNSINNNRITLLPLMISESFKNISQKEIELLMEKTIAGNFYEFFLDEFQNLYNEEDFKSKYEKENEDEYMGYYKQKRKVIKHQLLAMLFAKAKHYKGEQKIFSKYFPEILTAVNDFKKKYGYKKLSHLLFQVESDYLINRTARKFNRENWRKAPIFTLHDALITTYDYKNVLERTINENLLKLLDYAPMMKIKPF